MEEQFPPKEFAEFYYHDYDGVAQPYCAPVNPVHTIYALKGSDDAIRKAASTIGNAWVGRPHNMPDYEHVSFSYNLGYYIIDIEMNNLIADQFDALVSIPGVTDLLYFIYDKAHKRLITNDRKKQLLTVLDLPDYNQEIDDEGTLFPDNGELSLPTE